MAKSSTSFKKGEKPPEDRPIRGRSKKNQILDAIKEHSLLNATPEMDNEQVERLFFAHTAMRAFDPEDDNNAMLLKVLWDKGWSSVKPELEKVTFDFDPDHTAKEQSTNIIESLSNGEISPDAAKVIIDIVKSAVDIEVNTELKQRIEDIERNLGINV